MTETSQLAREMLAAEYRADGSALAEVVETEPFEHLNPPERRAIRAIEKVLRAMQLQADMHRQKEAAFSILAGDDFATSLHAALDEAGAPRKSDDGAIIYGLIDRIRTLSRSLPAPDEGMVERDRALRLYQAIRGEAPEGQLVGVHLWPDGDWDVLKPGRVTAIAAMPSLSRVREEVLEAGYDAAIKAIDEWAKDFLPSLTRSTLKATASDLQKNRQTILGDAIRNLIGQEKGRG